LGFEPDYCPQAERYYSEAMSLPMYPGLTEADQDFVVETLRSALL
jgi:dTDP-4-amino-4,6-dideoxygalactose transaminase